MDKATSVSDRSTPHVMALRVMDLPVDVVLDGALGHHEDRVREVWAGCLRPDGDALHDSSGEGRPPLRLPDRSRVGSALGETLDVAGSAPGATADGTGSAEELAAALDSLSTAVTVEGIERHRGRRLLLHAAGLADPATGATTVLVAASGTGKTTAATLLGRHLEYVSDETVCVDPGDLAVSPYPKPLSVVRDHGGPKEQVPPHELGLLPVTRPGHLRTLVLLERIADDAATRTPTAQVASGAGSDSAADHGAGHGADPGAVSAPGEGRAPSSGGTLAPERTDTAGADLPETELTGPVPLVTALSTLVPNMSALPSLPRPLTTLLETIAACGGVRIARYREVTDLAEDLVHATTHPLPPAAPSGPVVSWSPPHPAEADSHQDTPPPSSGVAPSRNAPPFDAPLGALGGEPLAPHRGSGDECPPPDRDVPGEVTLAAWAEAVENPEDPSQLLVLLPDRLVVLGGIAPDVWHACREHAALSIPALAERLQARHGEIPEAEALTRECVGHLLDLAVLRPAAALPAARPPRGATSP